MPVINASATREDIRLAIGYNLHAVFEGSTTSASAGTTDLIDTKLRGGTDEHKGKWIIVTSGARDGDISQVTAYNSTTTTLTVSPVFGGILASGVTYEMWGQAYRPQSVHNWINQAIHYLSGKAYDPEEDVSLHLHPEERRYVIPSVFAAIKKLERRRLVTGVSIEPCESGWTQQANVTQAFDSTRRREGTNSLRLILAAALAAGDNAASKTITSLDISNYDFIEFWIRSSVATVAGDLTLRLTSGANTIAFNVPALVADTWTYVRVSMTADQARQLTAVVTVVLRQVVDIGAATLWLDDIKAVIQSTAQWDKIPNHLWSIDKEATEIVFSPAWGTPPYNLLKISGGDEPVLLNADATITEVDPFFIIAKATELALMATSGGPQTDPEVKRQQVAYWAAEAMKRLLALPVLSDYRQVT